MVIRKAAFSGHPPKLADVAARRKLAEGGLEAIEASNDPMIQLARTVDRPARRVRTYTLQSSA